MREVRLPLRVIVRLVVVLVVIERDLHAGELAFKDRWSCWVRAGVVLAGRPSLLHARRMVVHRLGLAVSVARARALIRVHAVLSAALRRVTPTSPTPSVRHLVHVWHAVVHHGENYGKALNINKIK